MNDKVRCSIFKIYKIKKITVKGVKNGKTYKKQAGRSRYLPKMR